MTRVLHVIPALAARYGGPSAATFGMCRALETAGIPSVVATTDADGPNRLDVQIGRTQDFRGVQAIFFRRYFGEAFKWSAGLAHWLDAHVRRFDLVHIHAVFSHSSLAAGRACRRAGVPYLVRPLGTLDPWSLEQKRARKQLLLRWGGRRLLEGAAGVHYTAADEQRLAESAVGRLPEGYVVPLGIDDAFFATPGRARALPPYVLVLARLDVKKGIDLLIRAFHEVAGKAEGGCWKLMIAGDGVPAFVSELKSLAAGGAARDRIVFTGWAADAAKLELLAGASLFVLPSHQENFGISVVEAMACGVPVLVTPGVNLASAIARAEAGWTVERTLPALAEALREAMADQAERERRGANAREFSKAFRWPAVAEALRVMYERAIQGEAAAAAVS